MPIAIVPDRSEEHISRRHIVEAEQWESVDVEDEPIEVELVDPFNEKGVGGLGGGDGITVLVSLPALNDGAAYGLVVRVFGKLDKVQRAIRELTDQ